jgi:HPt (histidine-containing phosphotransfer) domain-containing protein
LTEQSASVKETSVRYRIYFGAVQSGALQPQTSGPEFTPSRTAHIVLFDLPTLSGRSLRREPRRPGDQTGLLNLSPGEVETEAVNTLFRVAHSIKGGSAMFGFSAIASLTHVMETLLDRSNPGSVHLGGQRVPIRITAGARRRAGDPLRVLTQTDPRPYAGYLVARGLRRLDGPPICRIPNG